MPPNGVSGVEIATLLTPTMPLWSASPMAVAVFGPFVTVSTFRDDAEVLAMANDTPYGLGGGVWTSNLQRAHLMARHMETGMVWINCYKRFHPGSPFGGIKDSGYGREMGHFAMHEYTEPKSVWVNVDAKLPVFYPR